MQIFFVKNVGRIEKSLSLHCRGRKKSLKFLVLFQPKQVFIDRNKNNNHLNKQTL